MSFEYCAYEPPVSWYEPSEPGPTMPSPALPPLRSTERIVDALELRSAGFLFLDALRQDEIIAACPVLLVASGSFPDEERFCAAARQRGLRVMLEAVSFEELVAAVEVIVDGRELTLAGAAD